MGHNWWKGLHVGVKAGASWEEHVAHVRPEAWLLAPRSGSLP